MKNVILMMIDQKTFEYIRDINAKNKKIESIFCKLFLILKEVKDKKQQYTTAHRSIKQEYLLKY